MRLGFGQVLLILVLFFLLFGNLKQIRPIIGRVINKIKKFFNSL